MLLSFLKIKRHAQRILNLVEDVPCCWPVGTGDYGRDELKGHMRVDAISVTVARYVEDGVRDIAAHEFNDALTSAFLGTDHRLIGLRFYQLALF